MFVMFDLPVVAFAGLTRNLPEAVGGGAHCDCGCNALHKCEHQPEYGGLARHDGSTVLGDRYVANRMGNDRGCRSFVAAVLPPENESRALDIRRRNRGVAFCGVAAMANGVRHSGAVIAATLGGGSGPDIV